VHSPFWCVSGDRTLERSAESPEGLSAAPARSPGRGPWPNALIGGSRRPQGDTDMLAKCGAVGGLLCAPCCVRWSGRRGVCFVLAKYLIYCNDLRDWNSNPVPWIRGLVVASLEGRFKCASDHAVQRLNVADRPYFLKAIAFEAAAMQFCPKKFPSPSTRSMRPSRSIAAQSGVSPRGCSSHGAHVIPQAESGGDERLSAMKGLPSSDSHSTACGARTVPKRSSTAYSMGRPKA